MGGIRTGEVEAAQLLDDFKDIDFVEIVMIVVGVRIAIRLVRMGLPWIARHVPSMFRLYLLGAVPFIRLALLVLAVFRILPIVFNVTLRNFLVLAGAVGGAVGRSGARSGTSR
mgnify:CR=1 FL=1